MKRIKTVSNFQKVFIDILDGAFEFCLLFYSKIQYRESIRDSFWYERYLI